MLQGGPGSSGIGQGLLTEFGPFRLNGNSFLTPDYNKTGIPTVFANPHSWTAAAHILFIDAPAGVGFSYCTDDPKSLTQLCSWNDTSAALGNYGALLAFYDKYPAYTRNPLFIVGESYGGVYVPTLVSQIDKHIGTSNIPLKGMMVGDGTVGHFNPEILLPNGTRVVISVSHFAFRHAHFSNTV